MGLSLRAGLPLHLSLQLEAQESIDLLKLQSNCSFCFGLLHFGFFHALPESRLDYQPLFGKGACPQGMFSMGRDADQTQESGRNQAYPERG